MAATPGRPDSSIAEALLTRAHEFSFVQVAQLLNLLIDSEEKGGAPGRVRFRPALSLAFPAADVAGIETTGAQYRVEATFLGLYGPASPLPTFYTEELISEAGAELTASRHFLDLLNQRLFTLYLECDGKYRLFFKLASQGQRNHRARLWALAGGGVTLQDDLPGDPLGFLGILTQHPRCASGLAALVRHALCAPVHVLQCRRRKVPVPEAQRFRLGISGCTLGDDAVLGMELPDRRGAVSIRIGPLCRGTFLRLLPEGSLRRRLDALVALYLSDGLAWDLELSLERNEQPSLMLGCEEGGRLGWDSWLGVDHADGAPSVIFAGRS